MLEANRENGISMKYYRALGVLLIWSLCDIEGVQNTNLYSRGVPAAAAVGPKVSLAAVLTLFHWCAD